MHSFSGVQMSKLNIRTLHCLIMSGPNHGLTQHDAQEERNPHACFFHSNFLCFRSLMRTYNST
jgi:hypothetical protein